MDIETTYSSKPKKILIAEDDEELNSLLQKVLIRTGYVSEGVISGNDVLNKTAENKYDLYILNYNLLDMTAAKLVKLLKTTGDLTPFIVIAGHGNENIAVTMMKLGARDYLVKESNYIDMLPRTVSRLFKELELEDRYKLTESQLQESPISAFVATH